MLADDGDCAESGAATDAIMNVERAMKRARERE
jgi:hypothetical protein